MSSARNRRSFAPAGRVLLALAAARKGVVRAFSMGGGGGSVVRTGGKVGTKPLVSAAMTQGVENATPPETPAPNEDLMSFFLLRHGQTNFNAAGRIQVRVLLPECLCAGVCVWHKSLVR